MKTNLLNAQIKQSILKINFFDIRDVKDIEELYSLAFSREHQKLLTNILSKGEYGKLQSLEPVRDLLGAELTVIRFRDQVEKVYYAFYYASILLCQYPDVLEIFEEQS